MKVICPLCKTEHNIDRERIPQGARMARCKACGHRFALERPAVAKDDGAAGRCEPPARMRKIGVSLSKGGVGKTTTAVNLAMGLAMAGFRTLLIDADTQGQASYMLGVEPEVGLTELLKGDVTAEEAILNVRPNLWLLAGGKALAGVKRLIDRKDFGGELTLCEAMASLEGKYDYVIVDTSPGWDPITVNVLFYVEEILTPVSLEVLTLQGLSEFLKSLASIRRYHKGVALKYILPTFMDNRVKKSDTILHKLESLYGNSVCKPIHYNVRLAEAPAHGKSIYEFAPGSPGAQDYRELVRKVANNEGLFH